MICTISYKEKTNINETLESASSSSMTISIPYQNSCIHIIVPNLTHLTFPAHIHQINVKTLYLGFFFSFQRLHQSSLSILSHIHNTFHTHTSIRKIITHHISEQVQKMMWRLAISRLSTHPMMIYQIRARVMKRLLFSNGSDGIGHLQHFAKSSILLFLQPWPIYSSYSSPQPKCILCLFFCI